MKKELFENAQTINQKIANLNYILTLLDQDFVYLGAGIKNDMFPMSIEDKLKDKIVEVVKEYKKELQVQFDNL